MFSPSAAREPAQPTVAPTARQGSAAPAPGSAGAKRGASSRGPATPSRVVRTPNHAQLVPLSMGNHSEFGSRPSGSADQDDVAADDGAIHDEEIVDETEYGRRASANTSPPPRRQVTAAGVGHHTTKPAAASASASGYSSDSSTTASSRSVTPAEGTRTPPAALQSSAPRPAPSSSSSSSAQHHGGAANRRERPPLMSTTDVESPASPDAAVVPQPVAVAATAARDADSRRRHAPQQQGSMPPTAPAPAPPATVTTAGASSRPLSHESHPSTPPRVTLGRKELIGSGTFGSVYKALDLETNRVIAVKEIRLQHMDSTPQALKEIASLEREIHVMQRLSHPNIVKYLGYTRSEGSFNIHMEFVPCGTVSALLKTFGPLSPMQAALFTKQILAGLQYLHEMNIIHRDLKGDNLFVDTDGKLKVGDFGTAKELQTVRQSNSIAGTPYFMAPEVVKNGGHGLEADVWSVGCCVIQMLTGQPPYRNFDNQITVMYQVSKGEIESQIPPAAPDDAKDFIRSCCRQKPKDRLTVAQLLAHPWLTSAPPVAGIDAPPPPPPPPPPAQSATVTRSPPPPAAAASLQRQSPPPPSGAAGGPSPRPTSGLTTPRNQVTSSSSSPVTEASTPLPAAGVTAGRGVAAARAARKQQMAAGERPSAPPAGAGPGAHRTATPVRK